VTTYRDRRIYGIEDIATLLDCRPATVPFCDITLLMWTFGVGFSFRFVY